MSTIEFQGKVYHADEFGFLIHPAEWDEGFAEVTAPQLGITGGLTEAQWRIIRFIRDTHREIGRCPLVYQTCKMNGMHLRDMKALFPTGYLRGACKLAGLTYKEGYLSRAWAEPPGEPGRVSAGNIDDYGSEEGEPAARHLEKTYRIDARGFLVDPDEWDEQFAMYRAFEMKMGESLNARQWQVIMYLRERYHASKAVPTIYETCEANNMDLAELESLFPDGYHRGAVKLAGLRAR